MSKKTIKVPDLPTFDPARYLRDDEDIAAYLTQIIEEGDSGELAHALGVAARARSEEHTSELQSLMRISYAVFCLKKKKNTTTLLTSNYRTHTLLNLLNHINH